MRPWIAQIKLPVLFFLAAMSVIRSWDSSLDMTVHLHDETTEVLTLSHHEVGGPMEMERIMTAIERVGLVGTNAETSTVMLIMSVAAKYREIEHIRMLKSGVDAVNLVTPHSLAPVVYNFRNKNIIALVEHVRIAVYNARNGFSKLTRHSHGDYIVNMEGMSKPLNRHLMNNINSAIGIRYLEIGVWKGSTAISSLAGNEANMESVTFIDIWESNSPVLLPEDLHFLGDLQEVYETFRNNLLTCINTDALRINVVKGDCFAENVTNVVGTFAAREGKYNVVRV